MYVCIYMCVYIYIYMYSAFTHKGYIYIYIFIIKCVYIYTHTSIFRFLCEDKLIDRKKDRYIDR